jgi:putative glutamine amidotransferase
MNPLIGISLEWIEDTRGRDYGLHQLRAAYVDAVTRAGGIPVLLAPTSPPLPEDALARLLEHIDGLVITGGAFDIPPELYGEHPSPKPAKTAKLAPERTAFELALFRGATARALPVLGICGGMQLINVARGGTLYQHLPDELPGIQHEQLADRRTAGHIVEIEGDSRLAALVGGETLPVNSSHHQGVKTVAPGLRASARSPDGLVEAIEDPGAPFCLGVEWHPELLWDSEPRHRGLFRGLTAAATGVAAPGAAAP